MHKRARLMGDKNNAMKERFVQTEINFDLGKADVIVA